MLPLSLELKAAAALIFIAAALFAFHRFEVGQQAKGAAVCEAAHVTADHIEADRRAAAQKDIADETQRLVARDRAHAVALAGAAPGLRNAVAAALVCNGNPAAASDSASAPSAGLLLTDVLGAAEARLRDLAGEADVRRTPGLGCQQQYESLTVPPSTNHP